MRAVVLHSPRDWSVTESADPTPAHTQVILKVDSCGLCGTDLHAVAGDNPLVRFPTTPGHEFAGTVVAEGSGVQHLAVGDRVAVDPSWSCGTCLQCHSGWPNLCPDKGGHGSRFPGGLAELVTVDESSCAAVTPNLSLSEAALAEPLACVLHGLDRLGAVVGHQALLYGAGAMGMLIARLLDAAGAQVSVVEPSQARRDRVDRHLASAADADTFGHTRQWDVVVDATGVPVAIEDGISRLGRAGRFLLLGVAPQAAQVQISPFSLNWREQTFLGSMAVRHSFHRAVDLLNRGIIDVSTLVTHRLPLDDFAEALRLVTDSEGTKIQIAPTSN